MKRAVFAVLFIAGCGYSEEQFTDDFLASTCDLYTRCEAEIVQSYVDMGLDEATATSTWQTATDTICNPPDATDTGTVEDNCTFNADNAQTCIDEMDALDCAAFVSGSYAFPTVCSQTCE